MRRLNRPVACREPDLPNEGLRLHPTGASATVEKTVARRQPTDPAHRPLPQAEGAQELVDRDDDSQPGIVPTHHDRITPWANWYVGTRGKQVQLAAPTIRINAAVAPSVSGISGTPRPASPGSAPRASAACDTCRTADRPAAGSLFHPEGADSGSSRRTRGRLGTGTTSRCFGAEPIREPDQKLEAPRCPLPRTAVEAAFDELQPISCRHL